VLRLDPARERGDVGRGDALARRGPERGGRHGRVGVGSASAAWMRTREALMNDRRRAL
jgi:hypothetical protein